VTVVNSSPAEDQQRHPLADGDADRRAAELIEAFAALPATHDSRASLRAEAIQAWLPMAHRLARRYAGRGEPFDDLAQIAAVGLIKAVDRFDPHRGIEFAGYAIPTILGEIRRYFRDHSWSLRVPRRLQNLRMAIIGANEILTRTLSRAPTIADAAAFLGITEDEVLEGLEGARAYSTMSLSGAAFADGGLELGDILGLDDHGYDLVDLHLALGPALATLDERERRIVALRFYGGETQGQIAAEIGVSQMHVSRLLAKALARLRTHLGPDVASVISARRGVTVGR